ncbi:MAG: nitrilase-related carbon-nitrogen hydrolase [Armatimonadota bacterium]
MISIDNLKTAAKYILAVSISGIFIALSMPPYDMWWLAYFALAPLLVITYRYSPLLTYGTGMLAIGITGSILAGRIADSAHAANLVAGIGSLSQVIGLALCLISTAKKLPTSAWIVFAACAGVFGEWVISHLFSSSIAISQHENPYALRLSSITGAWGVTFIIWYVSACIAAVLMHKTNVRKPILAISAVILMLVAYVHLFPVNKSDDVVKVAAIQGPDAYTLSEETSKLDDSIKIAVWSECGLDPSEKEVFDCAKSNNIYIAANFIEHHKDKKALNISYYISPDGKTIGKCRKQHLFGKEIFYYRKSRDDCPVITDKSGLTIGLPTCYDTMFTDTIRGYVRDGAKLILVPNSDPEAPNHFFARMHAASTAFRAAENAVPIALADTMSISTIFDSSGQVVAESKHGVPGYITAEVALGNGRTIYNRTGDIFAYFCVAYVLIILAYTCKRRRTLSLDGAGLRETTSDIHSVS